MRWATIALLAAALCGCSTLSDRNLMLDSGAFGVVPIQLSSDDYVDISATDVTVDPATHVVYAHGQQSDLLAVVDGLSAHLVRYASVRPDGETGSAPEGLQTTTNGGAVFVRLPDYDGVPVMVHIGGEPNHVLPGDAVRISEDAANGMPRRLMAIGEESGLFLLADMCDEGIAFQCLSTGSTDLVICPEPLKGEYPLAMEFSPHSKRVFLLTATTASTSALHVYGSNGELWRREFPGGPVPAQLLIDEFDGAAYVIQESAGALWRFPADGSDPDVFTVESGPVAAVLDAQAGMVYVGCRDSASVVAVDTVTGQTEALLLPASPIAMAIDPDSSYVFAALSDGRSMAVIDTRVPAVSLVDVGGPQLSVDIDEDYGLAYVLRSGGVLARMSY